MDTYTGIVLAALIFVASLVSVELGISAAIIEITMAYLLATFFMPSSLIGSNTSRALAASC